jgi:hypothetical protein
MKKYNITASSIVYYTLEIEAENYDEAREIACDTDGASFEEDGMGDWAIIEVREVTL